MALALPVVVTFHVFQSVLVFCAQMGMLLASDSAIFHEASETALSHEVFATQMRFRRPAAQSVHLIHKFHPFSPHWHSGSIRPERVHSLLVMSQFFVLCEVLQFAATQ